jgi:hypothetical protein
VISHFFAGVSGCNGPFIPIDTAQLTLCKNSAKFAKGAHLMFQAIPSVALQIGDWAIIKA